MMRPRLPTKRRLGCLLALAAAACRPTGATPDADSGDRGAETSSPPSTSEDPPTVAAGVDAAVVDAAVFARSWPEPPPLMAEGDYDCLVGIADPLTTIDYQPLEAGGPIPIGGTGQAGLTAKLALRISHPEGQVALEAAIIDLVLTHIDNGATAPSKPWQTPVRLFCLDDGSCFRAPIEVEITHLTKLPELEGSRVIVDARVYDADDPTRVLCNARGSGVLEQI
ncbi:MAG: hypothetical protein OEZ06_08525 [Myxococcales bacterium]|nr:hypothetical protein [Myxococcales bacterium]